jgi:hypothetical protein
VAAGYRWPNGSPGPSPVLPGPVRPDTIQARCLFVPGRVGPPGRTDSPGPTLRPFWPCRASRRHGRARRPDNPTRRVAAPQRGVVAAARCWCPADSPGRATTAEEDLRCSRGKRRGRDGRAAASSSLTAMRPAAAQIPLTSGGAWPRCSRSRRPVVEPGRNDDPAGLRWCLDAPIAGPPAYVAQ